MANESVTDKVIQLLMQGKFIKEISQELGLSPRRVSAIKKTFIERINSRAKALPRPLKPTLSPPDNKKEDYSGKLTVGLKGEDLNRYKERFRRE